MTASRAQNDSRPSCIASSISITRRRLCNSRSSNRRTMSLDRRTMSLDCCYTMHVQAVHSTSFSFLKKTSPKALSTLQTTGFKGPVHSLGRSPAKYRHVYLYIHTYMHACMHTCMPAYIHTYIHTYIRTYVHTYIHTYIHACMNAYIHTYTHMDSIT